MTTNALMNASGEIDLKDALGAAEIDTTAPIFVVKTEGDGSVTGEMLTATPAQVEGKYTKLVVADQTVQASVFVDYYVAKRGDKISELQIDAANFAGYYYVEASTLFRKQENGVDMPAEITFPNVKIQSNFTFSMASSGDPSTFTFTMDCFPGYTYFDKTRKVLCVIQVIEDAEDTTKDIHSVMGHDGAEDIDIAKHDSAAEKVNVTVTPSQPSVTVKGLTATFKAPTSSVEGIILGVEPPVLTVEVDKVGIEQNTPVSYKVESVDAYNAAHPNNRISKLDVVLNETTGSVRWTPEEPTG